MDAPSYKYKGYSIYYYPGDRIEIRNGILKIVIHKPGRCKAAYSGRAAYKDGMLTFSSNASVTLNLHECMELCSVITMCIDKLNAEGGNQIINSNAPPNEDELVPFDGSFIPKQVRSLNRIKPSQLKPGNLYETPSGKKCIYLGKGKVTKQGKRPNGDLYEYPTDVNSLYHIIYLTDSEEYCNIQETVVGNNCIKLSRAGIIRRESRKTPYEFTRDLGIKLPLVGEYVDKMGSTGLRIMIFDKLRGITFLNLC